MTKERIRAVVARLREGYTPQQIKAAIDACAESAWHQGDNDRGRRYDDIGLICRNGSKLESFFEQATTMEDETVSALRVEQRRALREGNRDEYERINEDLSKALRRADR